MGEERATPIARSIAHGGSCLSSMNPRGRRQLFESARPTGRAIRARSSSSRCLGASDLAILLGAWATLASNADLDLDGDVDATDMSVLLGGWGHCPTSNACFAHSAPMSDQPGCNGCVCAFDPTCCQVAWDADCVALAAGQCKAACQCGL